MADTITKRRRNTTAPDGFDVTCVIGRVSFDGEPGSPNPHVVAFQLIAEHDSPGTYRFPAPDGSTTVVTVSYEGDNAIAVDDDDWRS
jgi:hypothetical protein